MLNIKERDANTVQPPEADTVVLFLDAADSKLKLKDSNGDLSEVSTNVIGIPDGGATGEVLSKNSATDGDVEWVDPTGGVKEYVALLTQTGTNAPVATVLKNTLGGTVVWTYDDIGQYIGTLADAFVLNKTNIQSIQTHIITSDVVDIEKAFTIQRTSDDALLIITYVAGAVEDVVLSSTFIKIEVYP